MSWTKVRIEALKAAEIRNLRANAHARGSQEVVALCDEVLVGRPKERTRGKAKRQHELDGRRLVSRSRAFEMRGVKLRNPRWSWGGIRESDGMVVFTVWATDVERAGDTNKYLLFGPDRGGDRPWSDSAGGKERLRHCEMAASSDEAEGILIYGERRGRDVPLEEVSKVTGADPQKVLRFKVHRHGEEYWAVWSAVAQ
ncbi:MAG: hypothetical protein ACT4P9_13040 [Betaproteobacteria bacterium]